MAAHGPSFIRLRLFFDYPPPAVVGCRMCWLLVDLNSCRVVADLESIIREKFEFSRGSILSLFLEDCYLPHTENIYVVRDNDSVRVKVDCLDQVNGHTSLSDTAADTCRKRQRETREDRSGDESESVQCKKKKKKKRFEEISAEGSRLVTAANKKEKSQVKKKKKKKKTAANDAATPKPAAPNNNQPLCVSKTNKSSKNMTTAHIKAQNSPWLESSSSSSEEKKALGKKTTKASSSVIVSSLSASKANPKPTLTPAPTPSSSETDSSSDEAVKVPPKPSLLTPTTQSTNSSLKPLNGPVQAPADTLTEPQTQNSNQLVNRRPQQHTQSPAGRWGGCTSQKDGVLSGTGHRDGWKAESKKRGESSFEPGCRDAKEPSYQTDLLTNVSVVLENGAESVPQKDYSSMPLLAASPQVGQTIAFKLLELTENYTPEVSEYKEGKIISFDPTTKHIELELLNASQAAPVEPGKFDLVYQNPDGSERVEYAVPRGSWVTESWESLLEPRLII